MMASPLLWEQAYAEIASNKGALTPGVTNETLDGFSIERVERIIGQIMSSNYRFTPVRRVHIPKANGKTRPLGIPTASDKLVQAVVKLLLERIYEPVFSPLSHGFRRRYSCHTALEHIKKTWHGVKWLVDVDVVSFFDNINHSILLDLLRKKIDDKRFISLIEGMLKAGYMDNWTYHTTYSGTPQGGVVSPILANIYLHELDQFLTKMKAGFDKGQKRSKNPDYDSLARKIHNRRRKLTTMLETGNDIAGNAIITELRTLEDKCSDMPSTNMFDPNFKRLLFCRYADDFLIGVIGSKAEANEVMHLVMDFLHTNLRLEASPEKSKLSKASDGTLFLGYTVKTFTGKQVQRKKIGQWTVRKRNPSDRIQLRVPRDRIAKFNQRQGYGDLVCFQALHRPHLMNSSLLEITMAYNAEIRGFANYYRLAHYMPSDLSKLRYLWVTSLLKTLATKQRLTVNQVAHLLKTPNGLAVRYSTNGTERLCPVFKLKDINRLPANNSSIDNQTLPSFTFSRTDIMDRLNARQCEHCGATDQPCEVHHVRHLKDMKNSPFWKYLAAARTRKRIVLCQTCHRSLHAGKLQASVNLLDDIAV
jgi:RNA-directed DNA polymerase